MRIKQLRLVLYYQIEAMCAIVLTRKCSDSHTNVGPVRFKTFALSRSLDSGAFVNTIYLAIYSELTYIRCRPLICPGRMGGGWSKRRINVLFTPIRTLALLLVLQLLALLLLTLMFLLLPQVYRAHLHRIHMSHSI